MTGRDAITMMSWVAFAIGINTSVTVWLLNTHADGLHAGGMPANVFAEYRTSVQLQLDSLVKQFIEKSVYIDREFASVYKKLERLEDKVSGSDAWQAPRKNLVPPE
jgi:hypothetical protein